MEIAHVDTAHKRMTRLTPLEIRVQFRLWHGKTKNPFQVKIFIAKQKAGQECSCFGANGAKKSWIGLRILFGYTYNYRLQGSLKWFV